MSLAAILKPQEQPTLGVAECNRGERRTGSGHLIILGLSLQHPWSPPYLWFSVILDNNFFGWLNHFQLGVFCYLQLNSLTDNTRNQCSLSVYCLNFSWALFSNEKQFKGLYNFISSFPGNYHMSLMAVWSTQVIFHLITSILNLEKDKWNVCQ